MPTVRERMARRQLGEATHAQDVACLRNDGSSIYVDIAGRHIVYRGRPGTIGFFRDTTERRQLRESETRLRILFENLPDLIVIVDCQGIILFVNHNVQNVTAQQLRGRPAFEFLAPAHREQAHQALDRALADTKVDTLEVCDVFGQWWDARIAPIHEGGSIRQVMVICSDITQRKKAEEAILNEQRLLRQLLELHERDRQLIAYEIHDGFAQQLTGALLKLQAYEEVHARHAAEAGKIFADALQLLRDAMAETRRLISGLRPPVLDESGIVMGLDYLVSQVQGHCPAKIEYTHHVQFDRLAPPLESAIYRIVQESLSNACRYSQAHKMCVHLWQKDRHVRVRIRDWGVGFDPRKIADNHFGVRGIRERARLLGGRAIIRSVPGHGTNITVELPIVLPSGGTEPGG